ncbi:uncharacterized protein LOC121415319 isoform X2 [Lytechinus variegatus]|uniref:uncharacterized protein LOC121415319 isoform X2 n=1 Tax=Lytechinus variegatus TaxID=7654 RepID=UPI001BB0F5B3|nr:uncharacterized protein LOC121415319 isoform X2 [Lytechinus variegatus]
MNKDPNMAESSSKECKIPEELKKFTRAVLLSKIGGVPLEKFGSDFKKLAGYPLHFKELGFSTLRLFLEAMPDAVRFEYSDEASKWMLYGIGDPNTYMSSAAKKAQYSRPGDGTKDNNNRKRNRKKSGKPDKGDNHNTSNGDRSQRPASRMGVDDERKEDGELRIPMSQRGFYSVCVYYKNTLGERRYQIMQEIVELFATQGDVVEKSCLKNLMFFRFLSEDEAISVVKLYNGRCLSDGTQIRVQPATEKLASNNKKPEPSHGKPSLHEQRKLQGDLIHQHLQNNEHIRAEQQMFQQHSGAWLPDQFMSPYIGMQDAYTGMHGGPFLQGHPHMNNDNLERRANPAQELCVLHLNRSITVEDLMTHFWPFNPLFARMRSKTDGNDRKFFAFVAFGCIADAHNAEAALQGSKIKGCRISLEVAKTKRQTDRSAGGDATLQQDKNSNNVKPSRETTESRDQRHSSLSDVESVDSISAEVEVNDDPNSPSYMDSTLPVIDDSPYTANKTSRSDDTMSSGGSEDSSVTSQQGGVPFGRGRGSLLGYLSPSPGRGLALLSTGTEKKKPRPSLADLADRLHEL